MLSASACPPGPLPSRQINRRHWSGIRTWKNLPQRRRLRPGIGQQTAPAFLRQREITLGLGVLGEPGQGGARPEALTPLWKYIDHKVAERYRDAMAEGAEGSNMRARAKMMKFFTATLLATIYN